MEYHVLRCTGSPSEDCPSVSNTSTQSLVGLLKYRRTHHHDVLYHPALDRYVMLPDRTPRTRTMKSHSICSKDFCDPWYTHTKKYYPPSAHLLLSGLLLSKLTTCGKSMPLAIVHQSHDLGPTCGTHHCGENMENVVEETDNRILEERRCHLETLKGATHGKVYLRSLIRSGLMYPPFWFSTLESKKAMLILLEGNLRSLSQKGLSYPTCFHT